MSWSIRNPFSIQVRRAVASAGSGNPAAGGFTLQRISSLPCLVRTHSLIIWRTKLGMARIPQGCEVTMAASTGVLALGKTRMINIMPLSLSVHACSGSQSRQRTVHPNISHSRDHSCCGTATTAPDAVDPEGSPPSPANPPAQLGLVAKEARARPLPDGERPARHRIRKPSQAPVPALRGDDMPAEGRAVGPALTGSASTGMTLV